MNKLKYAGIGALGLGGLTDDQWLLIISILLTVLGMLQDYLRDRKNGR